MRVAFGELRFDGETRRLERRGDPVHLTPKAFRLLEILLEERPRAVAKQELCDRLWPDVVVDQGNLTNLVAEIRRALGSAGGEPAVIRTARRFGYAFDGEAYPVESAVRAQSDAGLFFLATAEGRIRLRDGANVLGRAPDCEVAVSSRAISRRHAQIVVTSRAATIEDLGSRNGTFVGASRVSGVVTLCAGDRILLGSELIGTIEILAPPDSTITESRARS